ncbi:MAG TPA: hypothetical protein VK912_16855 [Longimicrobiales bacterium]|nr:hypothetical protein [Longimicrobiales bacterium]
MRRRFAAVLLVAAGLAAATALPASAQRVINERFAAAPDGYVRVQNIAGSIKLIGWDRDSIAVTGKVHDTPAERFEVHRSGDGVKIGLWDTTVERAEPSYIEVRVPARSRVWVRTGSAAVFVEGVSGTLDVNAVGGDIEVRGAPAEVFAESMTGRLTLDVRTSVARAKTVTGAILLRGTIADATATSVSGNVLLEDAFVRRGSFESVDGELRFVGELRRGASLDFVTHAGAVEFLLPAATDAEFRYSTYEGGLRSEFKTPIRSSSSKIKGSEQNFVLGQGGAQVSVRTFRGRLTVRSR